MAQLDLASVEGLGLKSIMWEPPTDIQLAEDRKEFRNLYGYAADFLNSIDLFGEKKTGMGEPESLRRRGKGKDPLEEKFENYTPQMVTRYLQRQINEIALALKKEQNLNQ